MNFDSKVFVARLYEHESAKGNRYFSGRLGAARIMLLRDHHADADNAWQLFVQDGGEKAPETREDAQKAPSKAAPRTRKAPKAPKAHQRR